MKNNLSSTLFGVLLSLFSSLLLWLAYPPYDLGLLIWVGFVPMLVAEYFFLPARFSSLAPAISISGWMGSLLVPAFGGKSPGMVLLPAGIFLLIMFTDRKKCDFHQRTAFRLFVLEGVTGWVGLEMIRSMIPAIGTWLFVGYPLWRFPEILQPLSILGIYGLDLLIMGCNYTLGLAAIRWMNNRQRNRQVFVPRKTVIRSSAVVGGLILAWLSLSLWIMDQMPGTTQITAGVIQPNLPTAAHRDGLVSNEERLSILAEMTREAARQGAEIIVWPEMALGFDPQVEYSGNLKQIAEDTGAYLVIGYVIEDQQGFRNEAVLLTPTGEFLEPYGKAHPMLISGEPRSVLAGRYPTYQTELGRVGIMICFDADFTDVARALTRQGAQVIANPALFGPGIANLTQAQIVFRAIENRTTIILADVAYSSAIIDPTGKVIESVVTPGGAAEILIADVSPGTGGTFYARCGDWLGWISLAGMAVFVIWMNWKIPKRDL